MNKSHFAVRLRQLREAAHLTVTDLADASGLSRQGINYLEAGERAPSWETICALADALGCSTEEFRKTSEKSANSR